MKTALAFLTAICISCAPAFGQLRVTLTVSNSPGFAIPDDFSGLSFGAVSELPGHGGVNGHLFSGTNTQLITLFKNSGLRNLRIGGSTVEGTNAAVPTHEDIDEVFAFAKAADIKVIYSLRLLEGDPAVAAADAKYIWEHYRDLLSSFALGNEPDVKHYHDGVITNYSSYLARWREFAAAVTNAVPGATFCGPDAAGKEWATRFAKKEKDSGIVSLITQHIYVGGSPFLDTNGHVIPAAQGGTNRIAASLAISNLLSANWVTNKYPAFYERDIAPILDTGLPYRLTEADDYLRGVPMASDAFASALWALDFLHWWAAHDCSGVNFHNTEWVYTDTVHPDASGDFQINPKGYATRAFDLGSHGKVVPVALVNSNNVKLTAYAVLNTTNLYITFINKEYGDGAHDAVVTILTPGLSQKSTEAIYLRAPDSAVNATNGITLGGVSITNDKPWDGKWSILPQYHPGETQLIVSATTAAVLRISVQ